MAASVNQDPLALTFNRDPFSSGYFGGIGGSGRGGPGGSASGGVNTYTSAPGSGGTLYGTGGTGGTVDPITDQFTNIRRIIGTPTGPSLPGLSPTGSPSYTAGPNSSDILRQGINLVGGQGVNLSNLGNLMLGTGVGTQQPSIDFYTKLLSGDPSTITSALAPTASAVEAQYQPLISNAAMNMPRGGFGASTAAELPFTIANQVGNAALGLQPEAADKLATIGQDLAKLGLTEQTLGQAGINDIIQAALGKMGVTTGITQNLANIGGFLSGLI